MPGGIRLAERAPADIDTPAAGKITIFPDSSAADILSWKDSAGVVHHAADTAGYQPLDADLTNLAALTSDPRIVGIPIVIDGGGSVISTGVVPGSIPIPFACTILEWTILLDQSGSIVIDIWKDTYANYPPTVADTITAAAKPTVTTATKNKSSTLTGWTTAIAAGDILRCNVDSVTSATSAMLLLKVQRA
jgi:hypothetical protein